MHEGFWEVLDEGVRGSLTTHLQEVLPAARDGQSLTFKETTSLDISVAARTIRAMVLRFPPMTIPTQPSVSEITERFELVTPKTH